MNEIACPHCGKAFKVDETGYADIHKQVRDEKFDSQLKERLELAKEEKLGRELQGETQQKDVAISELQAQLKQAKVDTENATQQAQREKASAVELTEHKVSSFLQKRDSGTEGDYSRVEGTGGC